MDLEQTGTETRASNSRSEQISACHQVLKTQILCNLPLLHIVVTQKQPRTPKEKSLFKHLYVPNKVPITSKYSRAGTFSTGHRALPSATSTDKGSYNWEGDNSLNGKSEGTEVILKNPHYLKVTLISFTALHVFPNLEVWQAALMSRWWTSKPTWTDCITMFYTKQLLD